jgi:hypothetical protein
LGLGWHLMPEDTLDNQLLNQRQQQQQGRIESQAEGVINAGKKVTH